MKKGLFIKGVFLIIAGGVEQFIIAHYITPPLLLVFEIPIITLIYMGVVNILKAFGYTINDKE